ncbi:M50 family metallopeptidase [Streptomyces sp. PRKS01-29]|nr:M50 family metallopeptidase [Streptomyces sabulosicollis]MBI0293380.1 M50 family metallopeptidase [Streptomyces sabulosicollis]
MRGDEEVRGVFPARFHVGEPDGDGRTEVRAADSTRRWVLGRRELRVARQFDGIRSYADIARSTAAGGRPAVSVDALRRFEARLLRLGVLENAGAQPGGRARRRLRAWFRACVTVEFVGGDPTRLLDRLDPPLRRLTGRGPVLCAAVAVLSALAALGPRADVIAGELRAALEGAGLLGFLAAFVVSAVFHEGGHVLACHRYRVPVERVSLGLRWLIPFAWTRPEQQAWKRLPAGSRVMTAVSGPLGSLVFAALGGAAWHFGHDLGPVRLLGLYVLAGGTVGMVPTLVPTLDGDAYLLLELWLGRPNLRGRSIDHLVATFTDRRRAARTSRRERLLYVCFGAAAVISQTAATGLVLWAAYWFSIAPLTSS